MYGQKKAGVVFVAEAETPNPLSIRDLGVFCIIKKALESSLTNVSWNHIIRNATIRIATKNLLKKACFADSEQLEQRGVFDDNKNRTSKSR